MTRFATLHFSKPFQTSEPFRRFQSCKAGHFDAFGMYLLWPSKASKGPALQLFTSQNPSRHRSLLGASQVAKRVTLMLLGREKHKMTRFATLHFPKPFHRPPGLLGAFKVARLNPERSNPKPLTLSPKHKGLEKDRGPARVSNIFIFGEPRV